MVSKGLEQAVAEAASNAYIHGYLECHGFKSGGSSAKKQMKYTGGKTKDSQQRTWKRTAANQKSSPFERQIEADRRVLIMSD